MNEKIPIIAAFDFDGTITHYDTLIPFLIASKGWLRFLWYSFLELPSLVRYALQPSLRQQTKEAFIKRFFGGMLRKNAEELGRKFAENTLDQCLRPEAVSRLRWHQERGHMCILVSANLDLYLVPWAERMGFDTIHCSVVATDDQQKITGKLVGLNCWGEEKARRLKEQLGPRRSYLLYAYGDSRGDHQMLQLADYPFYRSMGEV